MTSFLVDSYKSLQQDPATTSMLLLQQISVQLNSFTVTPDGIENAIPPITYLATTAFVPSNVAVRVNALWFASLIISLSTSSFGMLVKQWLREYLAITPTAAQVRLRVRYYRAQALSDWKVLEIAAVLPLLLQVSLGLFLIGLCHFTADIHSSLGCTSVPLACTWGALPVSHRRCLDPVLVRARETHYQVEALSICVWSTLRHGCAESSINYGRRNCYSSTSSADEDSAALTLGNDVDILITVDVLIADDTLFRAIQSCYQSSFSSSNILFPCPFTCLQQIARNRGRRNVQTEMKLARGSHSRNLFTCCTNNALRGGTMLCASVAIKVAQLGLFGLRAPNICGEPEDLATSTDHYFGIVPLYSARDINFLARGLGIRRVSTSHHRLSQPQSFKTLNVKTSDFKIMPPTSAFPSPRSRGYGSSGNRYDYDRGRDYDRERDRDYDRERNYDRYSKHHRHQDDETSSESSYSDYSEREEGEISESSADSSERDDEYFPSDASQTSEDSGNESDETCRGPPTPVMRNKSLPEAVDARMEAEVCQATQPEAESHVVSMDLDPETPDESQETQPDLEAAQPTIEDSAQDGQLFGYLQPLNADYKRYNLPRSTECIVIGREKGACGVVIPSVRVSAQHCTIKWFPSKERGSQVMLTDISRNGTFVNGQRLGKTRYKWLQDQDLIGLSTDMTAEKTFVPSAERKEDLRFKFCFTADIMPVDSQKKQTEEQDEAHSKRRDEKDKHYDDRKKGHSSKRIDGYGVGRSFGHDSSSSARRDGPIRQRENHRDRRARR
ncbi:hypothetical protein NM688_g3676 [Phlebia brevispora]|uniref:Uncharacterized protein n=1 Tax=Phlebia brevispora TaxID=194682 RepID=A0ACC1T4V5_9APHY|nr:hypothetical protein NM688_g3676 [Phlebia brevispora]